ncbi:2-hydroxyacid dehydrogenase [Mesorhizobium sp. CAU 1732]|uniref:2-hydroxyacid dehydrogenase n=1 Tax=Mesorhizobium sp. CAU 1732 TaxID=3140358 RepID=UPI003260BD8C
MAELERAFTLHRVDQAVDAERLVNACADLVRGVVTSPVVGIDRKTIACFPHLEIVSSVGVGYDSIDLEACGSRGIIVTNTPDVLNDDVADMALGLILMTRRRMVEGHMLVASGEWQKRLMGLTSGLKGKRVGILGLGRIGMAIAARCEPIGMVIGYSSRSRKAVPYSFIPDARSLAEWSDILVVAVPGGAETLGMVDAAVLDALGSSGTLINIARGSAVDEAALIDALQSGRISSAGLDVYRSEPDPDPRLTSLANVTLSPHHASGTVETRNAMAQLVVDNLVAHFEGRSVLTPVPPVPSVVRP